MKLRRKLREFSNRFLAEQSHDHLQHIREYEFSVVRDLLPVRGKLLEVGSGTGWQARLFSGLGYEVAAIDLASIQRPRQRCLPGHEI